MRDAAQKYDAIYDAIESMQWLRGPDRRSDKSPVVKGRDYKRRVRKETVMAVNLVEMVKGYLTPDIIQKACVICRRVRVSDAKGCERHRTNSYRGVR